MPSLSKHRYCRERQKKKREELLPAHGGYSRLPPPPNLSKVDALPGNFRQLMSFTSHPLDGSCTPSNSCGEKRKRRGSDSEKKLPQQDPIASAKGNDGDIMIPEQMDEGGQYSGDERRNNKRKRTQVTDLRFENILENSKTSQKKRERRKKYLESKKKKHKQSEAEENFDFPRHEQIEFGDFVQAPPKLLTIPKATQNVPDASQERAIEAYRKRKGWTSRPGLQLPTPNPAASL